MKQNDLNRAVARATGETVDEIDRRGFGLVDLNGIDPPDIDAEDTARYLDWDDVDAGRNLALFEQRNERPAVA